MSLLLIILILLYLLPTFIAAARKHKSGGSIFIINLFLGWSVIAWIICLAWSCSGNVVSETYEPRYVEEDENVDLIKCQDCDKLLSPEVKYCIRCGAKMQQSMHFPAKGSGFFLLFMLILMSVWFLTENREDDNKQTFNKIASSPDDSGNGYTSNQANAPKGLAKVETLADCDEPDCNVDGSEKKADYTAATKLISEQLKDCWAFPNEVVADTVVNVDIKISKDGTMQFVSILPTSKIDSANYQEVTESIQEAINDPVCNPLRNLPPIATYYAWKEVAMRFSNRPN